MLKFLLISALALLNPFNTGVKAFDCTNFNEQMCVANRDKCNWAGPLSGCWNRWLNEDNTIVNSGFDCAKELTSILQCGDNPFCLATKVAEIIGECSSVVCPHVPFWAQGAVCLTYCAEHREECNKGLENISNKELTNEDFISYSDFYNLDSGRQCLMIASKALYDQRDNEIYTGDYNKRWIGIWDKVMPPSAPKYSDCSAAVSWIYWTCYGAGQDFINGQSWEDGYTGTLDQHGTKISLSQAQPGDLVFYGNPIDHVAIYIGSGRVISHGSDPVCNCDVHYRSDLAEVRSYISSSEDVDCYQQQCSDFDYDTCLSYPNDCVYIDFQGCVDKRDLIQEVDCNNLNREQCSKHPKECIYIGCSYGCPGCMFRNETSENLLGSIQYEIQHSTSDYWGHSTSAGPDGGVEACAWAVNNIMSMSGIRKIGDNPNYVPSVVDALKSGRGRQIQASQAVPGDLVVACGEQHIGVCMENNCNTIDSNSSSRRCFCWRSGFNFDNYFGCGSATYWRVEN